MVASDGLVLTPAQRILVEKRRVVKLQRAAEIAAQHELEARNHAHVQEKKTRCQQSQRTPAAQRLLLRHVGQGLARVAYGERHAPSKAHSAPRRVDNNHRKLSGRLAITDHEERTQPQREDDYDEERFGPVRRPPRKQLPSLWVPIFELEAVEARQTKEEAERKQLADAVAYREQLAQQEADKRRKRQDENAVAEAYARAQAVQQAAWCEQEKIKQKQRQEKAVLEALRWQQDLCAQADALRIAQDTKKRNEQRVLERFRLLEECEKRRKAERKAAYKEEVDRVAQANKQQLELKRQAKLRDQQQDVELQKAYEKKLEMHEAARCAELDAIFVKQSHKVKLALMNVKSAEEKAHEDEQRALAVQAAVRARENQLLEEKECKKREAVRVQVQALVEQREEKRSRQLALKQEETAYANNLTADFQTWQNEQIAMKDDVRHRHYEYQKLVQQQMKEDAVRKADEDKYGMTLLEAKLNAKLLQKAGIAYPPNDIPRR